MVLAWPRQPLFPPGNISRLLVLFNEVRSAVILETAHDIEALTSGAMADVWSWVRGKIPAGVEVFDAHAHIGVDVDGRTMTADGMHERMEAAGVKRSIVFPLNDPNARDDYSGPNDVVWNAYEEYPSLFVPFFRLNPHLDYEKEFERCVERGFMGLKLHPVSQQFELDDERVVRLLGMAAEADVPVLIHAGFAMQRVVEPLLADGRGAPRAAPDPGPRRDGRGAWPPRAPSRTTPTCSSRPRWSGRRTSTCSSARSTRRASLRLGHPLRRPAVDAALDARRRRGRRRARQREVPGDRSRATSGGGSREGGRSRADPARSGSGTCCGSTATSTSRSLDVDREPRRVDVLMGMAEASVKGERPRRRGRRTSRHFAGPLVAEARDYYVRRRLLRRDGPRCAWPRTWWPSASFASPGVGWQLTRASPRTPRSRPSARRPRRELPPGSPRRLRPRGRRYARRSGDPEAYVYLRSSAEALPGAAAHPLRGRRRARAHGRGARRRLRLAQRRGAAPRGGTFDPEEGRPHRGRPAERRPSADVRAGGREARAQRRGAAADPRQLLRQARRHARRVRPRRLGPPAATATRTTPAAADTRASWPGLAAWSRTRCSSAGDGCGVPTFGMPLRSFATGFARLAAWQTVSRTISQAPANRSGAPCGTHPVHGRGARIASTPSSCETATWSCKSGAEGVFGAGSPDGWGLALKISDGAHRAVRPAALAVLGGMGIEVGGEDSTRAGSAR